MPAERACLQAGEAVEAVEGRDSVVTRRGKVEGRRVESKQGGKERGSRPLPGRVRRDTVRRRSSRKTEEIKERQPFAGCQGR